MNRKVEKYVAICRDDKGVAIKLPNLEGENKEEVYAAIKKNFDYKVLAIVRRADVQTVARLLAEEAQSSS